MTTAATSTISIQCSCGRGGKVPANLAGRKVRCTGCSQYLRVIAPDGAPATSATAVRSGGLDLPPEVERAAPEWAPPRPTREPAAHGAGRARARGPADGRLGEERRRDPDWERHLRAIAFWDLLGGVIGVCAWSLLAVLASVGGAEALMAAAVPLTLSVLTVALGYFLWTYNGTARLVHMALAGLQVAWGLYQMIGLPGLGKVVMLVWIAFPAAVLVVLLNVSSATICTPVYQGLVARTPDVRVRWWTSPLFTIPLLVLAVGVVLATVLVRATMISAG